MNLLELEQESSKCSRFDENKVSAAEVRQDVQLDQKFLVLLSVYLDFSPNKENFQVAFSIGDPRNPINFRKPRKWVTTIVASFFTVLVCKLDLLEYLDPFILNPCYQPHPLHRLATARPPWLET